MITITVLCQHCHSRNLIRYGLSPTGKQRYLCKDCGRRSRDNPTSNAYSDEERESILRAYDERSSLRGLSRTFGVARNTVTKRIKKKESELPPLRETLIEPDPEDREANALELDELWSFVSKKAHKRWIWIAFSRRTRQVAAYAIGDRSQATREELWEAIPETYRRAHCYSDFWKAYAAVIPADQHTAVGIRSGQTAHVERLNNTLRQRLARLVRQTLSFSKSLVMHKACLHLFLHQYNLARAATFR